MISKRYGEIHRTAELLKTDSSDHNRCVTVWPQRSLISQLCLPSPLRFPIPQHAWTPHGLRFCCSFCFEYSSLSFSLGKYFPFLMWLCCHLPWKALSLLQAGSRPPFSASCHTMFILQHRASCPGALWPSPDSIPVLVHSWSSWT